MQIATILLNGEEILSYKPDSGKIMTPTTMPWEVIQQLGERAFGASKNIAIETTYDRNLTEPVEHVFHDSRVFHVSHGRVVGDNHVSYVDAPTVQFEWFGIADWR